MRSSLGAAGVFVLLGAVHAALTLADIARPRFLAPAEREVQGAMAETPLAVTRATTVWRAWLGFNLSHALGLVAFGGLVAGIAATDFSLVSDGLWLPLSAVLGGTAYTALAWKCWFTVPLVALALGTVGLATGTLLA